MAGILSADDGGDFTSLGRRDNQRTKRRCPIANSVIPPIVGMQIRKFVL